MSIQDTLDERGARYGTFEENAAIAQSLKAVMRDAPKWRDLSHDQMEAL